MINARSFAARLPARFVIACVAAGASVVVAVACDAAAAEADDESCDNGFDDDGDDRIDCDDESCAFAGVCSDCGDGTVDDGEACDDGNRDDGDGCSARCVDESCEIPGGCSPPARPPCGDSVLQPGEACEDGNRDDGDGCSSDCQPELERCDETVPNVQCIDGNTRSGDGCSSTCRSEFCGDGIVQPTIGERCDASAPGAAALGCFGCQLTVCGNGVLEGNEGCDDGNRRDGDRCSSLCRPQ